MTLKKSMILILMMTVLIRIVIGDDERKKCNDHIEVKVVNKTETGDIEEVKNYY